MTANFVVSCGGTLVGFVFSATLWVYFYFYFTSTSLLLVKGAREIMDDNCMIKFRARRQYAWRDGSRKHRGVGMSCGKARRNEERLTRRVRAEAILKTQGQGYTAWREV